MSDKVLQVLHRQSGQHFPIMEQVHHIILNLHPGMEAGIKYGLPFYTLKKGILYLAVQKDIPRVGVVYGIRLKEIHHLLDFTDRKQIGHFHLSNMDEEGFENLYMVLHSAVEDMLR